GALGARRRRAGARRLPVHALRRYPQGAPAVVERRRSRPGRGAAGGAGGRGDPRARRDRRHRSLRRDDAGGADQRRPVHGARRGLSGPAPFRDAGAARQRSSIPASSSTLSANGRAAARSGAPPYPHPTRTAGSPCAAAPSASCNRSPTITARAVGATSAAASVPAPVPGPSLAAPAAGTSRRSRTLPITAVLSVRPTVLSVPPISAKRSASPCWPRSRRAVVSSLLVATATVRPAA